MGQGGSHWVHPSSPSSPGALRPELAEVGLVARPSAIRVLAPLHESKCKTRRLTSEYLILAICVRVARLGGPLPRPSVCVSVHVTAEVHCDREDDAHRRHCCHRREARKEVDSETSLGALVINNASRWLDRHWPVTGSLGTLAVSPLISVLA